MNKQTGIIVGAVVVIVVLLIALTNNKDDGISEIPRGATSTVGELDQVESEESKEPVVITEEEVVVEDVPANDERANVDGIEVMEPPIVSEETETSPSAEEPPVVEEPTATESEEEVVEEATTTPAEAEPEDNSEAETAEADSEPVVEEPVVLGSLVGHYMFDEGTGTLVTDSSGYENHGTLINTDETVWQAGQVGEGLKFDGINDYAKIPHSESLNIGAALQGYSISFWFKSDTTPSSEREILGKGARSGPAPFTFRLDDDGQVSFWVTDGVEASGIENSRSIVKNTWKHVVGVRDAVSDRLRLYVDREEVGGEVQDATNLGTMNTLDVRINRYDEGTTFIYGLFGIDDVRIYNHALTLDEVTTIYDEAIGF